jgi:oxygen-dependent protoporphyrinogen oxidase
VLSLRGKARVGLEFFVPRRAGEGDEPLASFVRRRFGREMFERLVQPLVGGIYTADPELLSLNATLPRFRQMELEHGSLIRATLRQQRPSGTACSGARYGQFAALRGGISRLIQALSARLPPDSIHLNARVDSIVPLGHHRWRLSIAAEALRERQLEVDGVILALPAYQAAKLLAPIDQTAAKALAGIAYASCAIVSLGYDREQIGHPLDGFGLVVPLVERRRILSCSFSSVKYAGRAPQGKVLLRVFIGGGCQPELLDLTNDQLLELARREVAELLQIRGQPRLQHLTMHHQAMPQYHVGHLQRIQTVNDGLSRFPSLAVAGNAYRGVGIPACVESGQLAAKSVSAFLKAQPGDSDSPTCEVA